jgi:hypothetical protein
MKTKKPFLTHMIAVLVGMGIACFVLAFYFSDRFYGNSEYELPKKTIIKKESPTGEYTAKILYEEKSKQYFIAIEGQTGTQTILDKEFVPYVGYHDPIIKLSWRNDDTVSVEVDHDFGEGNLLYEFNIRELDFKKVSLNQPHKQEVQ